MASTKLPLPGSQYGPCAEPCKHQDCARARADAAEVCIYCGESIGYNRSFYDMSSYAGLRPILAHALCAETYIVQTPKPQP